MLDHSPLCHHPIVINHSSIICPQSLIVINHQQLVFIYLSPFAISHLLSVIDYQSEAMSHSLQLSITSLLSHTIFCVYNTRDKISKPLTIYSANTTELLFCFVFMFTYPYALTRTYMYTHDHSPTDSRSCWLVTGCFCLYIMIEDAFFKKRRKSSLSIVTAQSMGVNRSVYLPSIFSHGQRIGCQ